jgi:hypothetical protein
MAKRRTYKRDKRGRFASTGSSRVKRITRKVDRRRPRYVRGSLGKTLRVGRVGPGGEYAGCITWVATYGATQRGADRTLVAQVHRCNPNNL